MRALVMSVIVAIVGVAAAAAPAHAQGYGPGTYAGPPPPRRGVVRSGFIAGLGLGGGGFGISNCDECDGVGAFSLKGHLGGMLGPRLALMFDVESATGSLSEDVIITQSTAMAVLRLWVGSIFYLQGGIGAGWLRLSNEELRLAGTSDAGAALMLGAGLEVMQRPSFTIDVSLRLIGTRYGNDDDDAVGIAGATLLLGFNWY